MRVAWFSDLTTSGGNSLSLSSYVSKMLLPLLRERMDIEVFSSFEGSFHSRPVSHYLSAFKRHSAEPFDVFFYQLEDTRESFFIRAHLGLLPGIVLFHDFFLSTDGPEPLLNSPWQSTVRLLEDPGAGWPPRDSIHERKGPRALRESALSLVAAFSSEREHNDWLRLCNGPTEAEEKARGWYLPVPAHVENVEHSRGRAIAFCGTPRIECRAHKIMQAVSEMNEKPGFLWLLDESERDEAAQLCDEFSLTEVSFVSPRSPEMWHSLLSNAGVAAHTLFSAFGHLNPYLPITLGAGVPAIVTNFAGGALLPDSVVMKVDAGESEAAQYRYCFEKVFSGAKINIHPAQSFAREMHSPEKVAGELISILEESRPLVAERMEKWKRLERKAARELRREIIEQHDEQVRALLEAQFDELGWLN